MKRYTLKTFYREKQLEIFAHRTPAKLLDILRQPKFSADSLDSFGDDMVHVNHIIIVDNQLQRVFQGEPAAAVLFVKTL